jgi:hypothetical protein
MVSAKSEVERHWLQNCRELSLYPGIYATSKLKRFGDYPTDLKPEAMPARTTLPVLDFGDVAGFRANLTGRPSSATLFPECGVTGLVRPVARCVFCHASPTSPLVIGRSGMLPGKAMSVGVQVSNMHLAARPVEQGAQAVTA